MMCALIENAEDAVYYLKIHGVDKSMEEVEKFFPLKATEGYINAVFEDDAQKRYALISTIVREYNRASEKREDKVCGIFHTALPGNDIYNYLDRGYTYHNIYGDHVVLCWDTTNENIEWEVLRKTYDRIKETRHHIFKEDIAETIIEIKRKNIAEKKRRDARKEVIEIKNARYENYIIDGDSIYTTDRSIRIGIKEEELYTIFPDDVIMGSAADSFNEIYLNMINKKMSKPGPIDTEIYAGKVTIKAIKKDNKHFLNDIHIRNEDMNECVKKAIEFQSDTEYNKFLKRCNDTSLFGQDILKNGLKVDGKPEIILRIVTESKKWYVETDCIKIPDCPIQPIQEHKKLHIVGGLSELASLNSFHSSDKFETLNRLKKAFGSYETAMRVLKKGFEEMQRAEQRARVLLDEIVQKHSENITRSQFNGKNGYIIEGTKHTYFLDDELRVNKYPTGEYVCIVDQYSGEKLHHYDKLSSRLLALLNDSLTATKISTL